MTNFERIKAMSVEELAATLADSDEITFVYCGAEHCEHYQEDGWVCSSQSENRCVAAVLHWLNSEAEEEAEQNGLTNGQKDALLRTFLGRGGGGA